jgi:hypothetical protein
MIGMDFLQVFLSSNSVTDTMGSMKKEQLLWISHYIYKIYSIHFYYIYTLYKSI